MKKDSKMMATALRLSKKGKYREALPLLKEEAKNGNPEAIYALGTWHLFGRAVKKNSRIAVTYFKKASRLKHGFAAHDLAVSLENGVGIEKNMRSALASYKRAALLGDKDSLVEVARIYFYGLGVKKDEKKAVLYYQKAAMAGNKEAGRAVISIRESQLRQISRFEKKLKEGLSIKSRALARSEISRAKRILKSLPKKKSK